MHTASASAEVAAAPEQVWAVAADLGRYGEWSVTHTGFPDGTPRLEPGAGYRENLRIMGMPGQVTWTVAELVAPSLLRLDGHGPMGIVLGQTLRLEPAGSGTAVTLEVSYDGGPVAGPMGAAVAAAGRKAAAESLEKLARLVTG